MKTCSRRRHENARHRQIRFLKDLRTKIKGKRQGQKDFFQRAVLGFRSVQLEGYLNWLYREAVLVKHRSKTHIAGIVLAAG